MPKPIESYDWILWDWNGTLIDDVHLSYDIFSNIQSMEGREVISLEQYRRLLCHPVKTFYERIGYDFSVVDYDSLARTFHQQYLARVFDCALHTGAREILSLVRERGVQQGILSALPQEMLVATVTHLGVAEFMNGLTSPSSHHAHGKIDEARAWVQEAGVDPEKILLIGDSEHDADVAREVGFQCVLVSSGYQHEDVLSQTGYTVYPGIEEIRRHWGK